MQWGPLLGSLALAGCLSAPPSSTGDGPDDDADPGDGDGGGNGGSLELTGLASRDPLTLDTRDELVIIGRRAAAPVAVVLFPGDGDLADVAAVEVDLPFEPIDLVNTRWGSATGLAVALGPDGTLRAIDRNAALLELDLVEGENPASRTFSHLSELDDGDRRLVLADDQQVLISSVLGTGEVNEAPLTVTSVIPAVLPVLVAGSYSATGAAGIGVLEGDREVDVYPIVTSPEPPTAGPDRTVGATTPDPLLRPSWRMYGNDMVLVGIDPGGPRLWYQSTSMTESAIAQGTALDGDLDSIHDLTVTRVEGPLAELILLAEMDGLVQVLVYLDPAGGSPESLPAPLAFPVGLEPPYWVQAMDVVEDLEAVGLNEIIAYDAAGHLACVDFVDGELRSCGRLDLGTVTASGASTSGRPGW